MMKTKGAAETIEAVREVKATNPQLVKARAAEASKRGQCMQAVKDSAERKITPEQEKQWLEQKGEPALAQAQWELRRVEADVDRNEITPLVNGYLGEATNRMIALLTEAAKINEENERFVTALRQMNVRSRSSVVVPDLDVLLADVRQRVARALAPQPVADCRRPAARQPDPNYEPFVAIVATAAHVAARD